MGFSLTSVACDAIRTRRVASYPLEKGRLRAISAFVTDTDQEPGQTYARLTICELTPTTSQVIAVLAEGYIGQSAAISWTGDIPMQSSYQISLEAWSSASAHVRASALTDDV